MQQATDLARQMVTRWGMSPKLGPVTLAPRDDPYLRGDGAFPGFGSSKPYSEETARVIDDEVERILNECYAEGVQLIKDHRESLDSLAEALLEHETLDEQEIIRVTGITPAPRMEPPPTRARLAPAAAFTDARPAD
jgi:cell division protease FtsH